MSVAVSHMPRAPGDILHRINIPAVTPPMNPLGEASSPPPDQDAAKGTDSTSRRLSSGTAFADAAGINLDAIGKVEARKIMSVEHKVLGFRPPQGSLAAEAQAAAAKHPEVTGIPPPDAEKLKEAATVDAQRILAERSRAQGSSSSTDSHVGLTGAASGNETIPLVDLSTLSKADVRKLMSHEHRALGFRPPTGSLAAEAQAVVAKHAEAGADASASRDERNSVAANGDRRLGTNQKPRRVSSGANKNGSRSMGGPKERNSDSRGRSLSGTSLNGNQNGPNGIRRANSGDDNKAINKTRGNERNSGQRRKSLDLSTMSKDAKDEFLREVALKDAERIKATRGIDGKTVSEEAHVDIKELPAGLKWTNPSTAVNAIKDNVNNTPTPKPPASIANLPGPVQEAQEARAAVVQPVQPEVDSQTTRVEIKPGKERVNVPEPAEVVSKSHVAKDPLPVLRTETTDSVRIVGDVLA